MTLRFLSVCSGIEAASAAWEPLGWTPAGFAEIEPFPCELLTARYGATRARRLPDPETAPDAKTRKLWSAIVGAQRRLPSGNGVVNYGDFTQIDPDEVGEVDLLVGGSPCQSFSVAGLRGSMSDHRGNLTLAYVRLVHAIKSLRWAVWENVPGVLSTDDNAFGCLLSGLVGGDAPLVSPLERGRWPSAGMASGPRARVAWRVLDAQHFGLAQRRERVFVVAGLGDGADPAAVLFERKGLSWDPEEGDEAAKDLAGTLAASLGGSDDNDARDGRLIAQTLDAGMGQRRGSGMNPNALVAAYGGNRSSGPIEVATTINAHGGPHGRLDFETETFIAHTLRGEGHDASEDGSGRGVPLVAIPILEAGSRTGPASADPKAGMGIGDPGDPMYTLTAGQTHGVLVGPGERPDRAPELDLGPIPIDVSQITSPDNRSNPKPGDPCPPLAQSSKPPAIAFNARQDPCATEEIMHSLVTDGYTNAIAFSSKDDGTGGRLAPTMRAMASAGSKQNGGGQLAVAYQCHGGSVGPMGTLRVGNGNASGSVPFLPGATAVRRLTPVECERLQGFLDNYTLLPGGRNRRVEDRAEMVEYLVAHGFSEEDADDLVLRADGPRYKALGNSFAVPVVAWIGARIQRQEAVMAVARKAVAECMADARRRRGRTTAKTREPVRLAG